MAATSIGLRPNLLAGTQAGAVARDHQVPLTQTGEDLDVGGRLDTKLHLPDFNVVFRRHDRHLTRRFFVAAHIDGGNRNGQRRAAVFESKVHLGEHSGYENQARILNIYLGVHGARRRH